MVHPAAHGFIGHQDPTLSQQILDIAEAQGEPDIKPDRLLDDFGREAVAAIADLGHHRWLRLKVTDGKPNGDVTMPLSPSRQPANIPPPALWPSNPFGFARRQLLRPRKKSTTKWRRRDFHNGRSRNRAYGYPSRLRCQDFLRPASRPDPGGRSKDVARGVHTGHGVDAVLPKSHVRLRASLSRAGPGVSSVQRRAQPQGAASALAAHDA